MCSLHFEIRHHWCDSNTKLRCHNISSGSFKYPVRRYILSSSNTYELSPVIKCSTGEIVLKFGGEQVAGIKMYCKIRWYYYEFAWTVIQLLLCCSLYHLRDIRYMGKNVVESASITVVLTRDAWELFIAESATVVQIEFGYSEHIYLIASHCAMMIRGWNEPPWTVEIKHGQYKGQILTRCWYFYETWVFT